MCSASHLEGFEEELGCAPDGLAIATLHQNAHHDQGVDAPVRILQIWVQSQQSAGTWLRLYMQAGPQSVQWFLCLNSEPPDSAAGFIWCAWLTCHLVWQAQQA